jgi:uncharacterized protein YyaL (SSP411 family)
MAQTEHKHTNRLAGETSPYLLQHAHNPVDWFPWGPDALARAKLLDRPIFLSIGYAACHWCHVMERESFEDESTAAFLNARFVAIKVDREERPDLDQIYMSAVQAMTGGGGWPMSVFLTPEGRPFYGGTYFPPEPRHGLPSFQQLLAGIDRAWREQRGELEQSAAQMVAQIQANSRPAAAAGVPTPALFETVDDALLRGFDTKNGSWGGAPKFPQPMTIEYLLRRVAGGEVRLGAIARQTLDRMADGGIRDQLGGGFHRYATDAVWLVPHFEQMLYDNAQLARVYLHAWALDAQLGVGTAGHADWYRDVAMGTLDYMLRELTTADGAFAASQDADTDGVEGATFTWRADEVQDALGDDAAMFSTAYGVTDDGNWEGVTILSRVRPSAALANLYKLTEAEVDERLARSREKLLAIRGRRAQPARDDKALAAWNGLAIGALADAARLLSFAPGFEADAARYRAAAARAADVILTGLLGADGRLGRSWKDGRATGQGVLEDYANLAEGLLALYEATFDERWFTTARALADGILDRFVDPEGGFFDTATDHERLVTRPKDVQDNATPSGGAMATVVLLRLAAYTGESRYRDAADRALATVTAFVSRYPTAFAMWLQAIDLALAPVAEIAIVGDPEDEATRDLLRVAHGGYAPHRVVANLARESMPSAIPLLEDRLRRKDLPTAYVCRNFACQLPVTDADALREQLAEVAAAV